MFQPPHCSVLPGKEKFLQVSPCIHPQFRPGEANGIEA
jgi:hypothetical protein